MDSDHLGVPVDDPAVQEGVVPAAREHIGVGQVVERDALRDHREQPRHVSEQAANESFLEPEQSVAESFVYNDTGVPAREVVLQQMIAPEEQQ